jgi:hypothetical protein
MTRLRRGWWAVARVALSWLMRFLAWSVVQGVSCFGERAPARVSASTWAN